MLQEDTMKQVECYQLTWQVDIAFALANQGMVVQNMQFPSKYVTPNVDMKIIETYLVAF